MAKPQSIPSSSVYRIKITLGNVAPPVWRRVEIEDCSLAILHAIIQDAMGWENYHLYEFQIDGVVYTDSRAVDEDNRDAAEMTLGQLAERKCAKFDYVYDFGDEWEHAIEIEAVHAPETDRHYPHCIEGQRACPPEDCGGPWGYDRLLEALKDPNHEEYDELLESISDDFDPEQFDAERVDQRWASWDFSDPDSGPTYEEDEPEISATEQRAAAKAAARAKSNSQQARVGRNDPCPCGSGIKYKKCCLKKGKDGNYDDE
ncbi:MAG: SEC-C domain-containing protein [Pirellulales bacterium]|nr:SEC-C domain-containing protein [Pirellulales bacterium]